MNGGKIKTNVTEEKEEKTQLWLNFNSNRLKRKETAWICALILDSKLNDLETPQNISPSLTLSEHAKKYVSLINWNLSYSRKSLSILCKCWQPTNKHILISYYWRWNRLERPLYLWISQFDLELFKIKLNKWLWCFCLKGNPHLNHIIYMQCLMIILANEIISGDFVSLEILFPKIQTIIPWIHNKFNFFLNQNSHLISE